MTEHHKQDYSNNFFFWFWMIFWGVVMFGILQAAYSDLVEIEPVQQTTIPVTPEHPEVTPLSEVEYKEVRATGDHDSNTCWFYESTVFDETVTIEYPTYLPGDDVIGNWDPTTNTISLVYPRGMDVQTVAHEVSHMVDTFMEKYQSTDPHIEAYMQGFWTWCVYEIMQNDLAFMNDPFAN